MSSHPGEGIAAGKKQQHEAWKSQMLFFMCEKSWKSNQPFVLICWFRNHDFRFSRGCYHHPNGAKLMEKRCVNLRNALGFGQYFWGNVLVENP